MKKFISRVGLFILPLLVVATAAELFLRFIPNDYALKKNQLEKNAEKLEVLIFGNSHAYRGLNPDYFTDNSFNAAYVSQTLDIDYRIFKKHETELKKLKTVIIGLSYQSLFAQLKTSKESWRLKNYIIYQGLYLSNDPRYYFELLSLDLQTNIKRIFDFYLQGKYNITSSTYGWGRFKSSKVAESIMIKSGLDAAIRHTKNLSMHYENNLHTLKHFIASCENNGVRVILLTLPAHKSYYMHLNKEQLATTFKTGQLLENAYGNCSYYNFLYSEKFNEEDFYNADHLNARGAKKLSEIINNLLHVN